MATKAKASSTSSSKLFGIDQLAGASNKVGNLYIDGYERSVEAVVGVQRKVAASAKVDRVQTVLEAQADLVSGVGEATVAACRKVVS